MVEFEASQPYSSHGYWAASNITCKYVFGVRFLFRVGGYAALSTFLRRANLLLVEL